MSNYHYLIESALNELISAELEHDYDHADRVMTRIDDLLYQRQDELLLGDDNY